MPKFVVTLLKATDLPASDFELVSSGKSDPYVVFKLGGLELKSTRIKKQLNPVWNPAERFEFEVLHVKKEVLLVEIYDDDTWNRDDLLGSAAVPVSRYESEADHIITETLPLDVPENFNDQHRNSTITLEICLRLDEGGQHTLKIWENERYVTTQGWKPSDANDRQQWSSYDESRTSASFEDVAPDVPPDHEAKGWGYSTQRGDAVGWEYAPSFAGPWANAPGTLSFARRRLWENVCDPN